MSEDILTKNATLYGSLYMDTGETFDTAKKQIDWMVKMKTKESGFKQKLFLFDIIITPSQRTEAGKMQTFIDLYARTKLLIPCEVYITEDENNRPGRNRLLELNKEKESN